MHQGLNCLLKPLDLETFISQVILFEAFLPHLNLLVMLRSSWRGISLELLFCLVADTRVSVHKASAFNTCNIEFPCNLLSVDLCVRHVQVCQLLPNMFSSVSPSFYQSQLLVMNRNRQRLQECRDVGELGGQCGLGSVY